MDAPCTSAAVRVLQFGKHRLYPDLVGLGLNTMYQLVWTLPHWDGLVVKHMAKHDTPVWYAAALLLAFGAIFHIHRYITMSSMHALIAYCACFDSYCANHDRVWAIVT